MAIVQHAQDLLDMGLAYAQQGEMEEACRVAGEALAITTHTTSLRVFSQVHALHSALEL